MGIVILGNFSEARPDGCVSIDHMVSNQPCLVPRQDYRRSLARI